MAITYNILNRKGGVGKTETALNMAYGLSQAGYKTLFIPLDPQANGQSTLLKDDNEVSEQDAINIREWYDECKDANGILKSYNVFLMT